MVELTQEQKAMLNLSKEKINDLATANPLARKASMNKIMKPFEEKVRDAARAIDESEKRDKALEDIPDVLSAARKYIKEQIKTEGKVARGTQAAFDTFLRPLTEMNIYSEGARINENYLWTRPEESGSSTSHNA